MWIRKMIAALAVLSLVSGAAPAESKEKTRTKDVARHLKLPDIIAKVNKTKIASDHVKFQFNRIMREVPVQLDHAKQVELVKSIIEKEVVRELVYQEAKAETIEVSKDVLEKEFTKIKAAYKSEKEFKDALKARNIDEKVLMHSMEVDLVARQLLDKQVRGKITIPDAQVETFYKDHQDRFKRPEAFRAQHIFIPHVPAELQATMPPEELKKKADEFSKKGQEQITKIYKELQDGGDFSELAKKYSKDAGSAQNGGDLDYIYKGVFEKTFDDAVAKLKKGRPVES